MEFKDYYKILGVARTAAADEIKKAFRKLAREYHPDVAKDKKSAEEKFKEINEAYEVLGDPEKRKKYDELGPNWKAGQQFRPEPGWEQQFGGRRPRGGATGDGGFNFEFGGTGFSDFFEQIFGGRGNGGRAGNGRRGGFPQADMAERGQDIEADIMVPLEEAARGAVRSVTLRREGACDACGGTGHKLQRTCTTCGGSGRLAKADTCKVRIPAGVAEGQKLRLSGRGETGAGGGEAGDLYLRVRIAKHPDFEVIDGQLHCEAAVAPWEAVLGASVSVPTLDGRVSIKIPPGTQSGQQMRLRGRGLPKAGGEPGDLIVEVMIEVPAKLTEAERKLWEQLAKESKFNPREG